MSTSTPSSTRSPLPPCPSPPINTVDDNTFDFFIPKDLLLTDLAPFFPFVVLD
ncbi:hypothetical protein JCM11641_001160, partial [Rhodosporidiobolus odoratus]